MAKVVKNKRNIRLRKRIRKTFGTLFLVSALAVAAIPADSLQAQNDNPRVTLTKAESNIPIVGPSETIYTTGDGKFQFAYCEPTSTSTDKVAIILGYNSSYLDANGSLTIPDKIDSAYLKYSDNLGSKDGYVAVGKSGKFLFYETKVQKTDENGNLVYDDDVDDKGEPIKVPVMVSKFLPCYYETYKAWSELEPEKLYYLKSGATVSSGDASAYLPTSTPDEQRIQNILVQYIGNQYLRPSSSGEGTWEIAGEVEKWEDEIGRASCRERV